MGGNNAHELVLLDQAGQALAEARSLDEIKIIRDKAEAVRKYAQSASLGLDVQNRAAEVKLRAERQAGKLLAQLMLRGGDRRSKCHSDRLKLGDLGLTSNQSKRWQLQARIPEALFREHVRQTREDGKELTSAGLMRIAKRLKEEAAVRNGQANGRNGHAANRHGLNGKSKTAVVRMGKSDNPLPIGALGDFVSELKNHHQVLDGILRPVYSGETVSLRPAEVRMLRYLITEMGGLIAQLGTLRAEEISCTCHSNRAAV
jgi:hypothetical protein